MISVTFCPSNSMALEIFLKVSNEFSTAIFWDFKMFSEDMALSAKKAVWVCVSHIIADISFDAETDCSASFLISSATTAKPLPASPARAASMDALSASKLV